jgi:hypothetical protein
MIVDYQMHRRAHDESIDHSPEAVARFVETVAAGGVDEIGFDTVTVFDARHAREEPLG